MEIPDKSPDKEHRDAKNAHSGMTEPAGDPRLEHSGLTTIGAFGVDTSQLINHLSIQDLLIKFFINGYDFRFIELDGTGTGITCK